MSQQKVSFRISLDDAREILEQRYLQRGIKDVQVEFRVQQGPCLGVLIEGTGSIELADPTAASPLIRTLLKLRIDISDNAMRVSSALNHLEENDPIVRDRLHDLMRSCARLRAHLEPMTHECIQPEPSAPCPSSKPPSPASS